MQELHYRRLMCTKQWKLRKFHYDCYNEIIINHNEIIRSIYIFHYSEFLLFCTFSNYLGAVHMSRASPANRADSILSPLMGA